MKVQSFVLCFLLTLLSVSCIREEAPNAEADILSCTVDGDILKAEPEIGNESVTLTVKSDLYGTLHRLWCEHGISFRAYNDGAEE